MTTLVTVPPPSSARPPVAFHEDLYDDVMGDLKRHLAAPASRQQESMSDRFARLYETWRTATVLDSSTTQKVSHPAYLAIVAMGPPAVPLILRELARRPGHWGPALSAITGAVPYAPELEGDLRAIARAWLAWGRLRGLVA